MTNSSDAGDSAAVATLAADEPARFLLKSYRRASTRRSLWQLVSTLTGFAACWGLAWYLAQYSYWFALPVLPLAAGLLLRLFVLAHDCGHGSFFSSKTANAWVGRAIGVLTLTPYDRWRKQHAMHHATNGDLDRRGHGDVLMLTVQEYWQLSRWQRFLYRVQRNPFIMFFPGPFLYFVVWQRFTFEPRHWTSERKSVHWTNVAIAVFFIGMSWLVGWRTFCALHLPIIAMASSAGVWLFYVQHHFEATYFQRSENWEYAAACLDGSSCLKLPRVLQWFSADIGFHHIHHLDSRIPNYRLQECFAENPELQKVKTLTLWEALACLPLRLWDEQAGRMVRIRSR